jgi:hypothetical protein
METHSAQIRHDLTLRAPRRVCDETQWQPLMAKAFDRRKGAFNWGVANVYDAPEVVF